MADLTLPVKTSLRNTVEADGTNVPLSVHRMVNEIDDDTDLEQVITFLDESGSQPHQNMALHLRTAFQEVLSERLGGVRTKVEANAADLYAVLLEMHELLDQKEELLGFMTLNYDDLLEKAIEYLGCTVDRGFQVQSRSKTENGPPVRVLSLHGSFSWKKSWPVDLTPASDGSTAANALWIPPGIRKNKTHYPFNAIWGLAREMLDCDTLRIIGCKLGKNDWDLVSMLFGTRHTHAVEGKRPYSVEIIEFPKSAQDTIERFPYLDGQTLLDIDTIGEQIHVEVMTNVERPYRELKPFEQEQVRARARCDNNPFRYWLKHKAEAMEKDDRSIRTKTGLFHQFLESY